MCRKSMDTNGKVRILALRQENVVLIKSADVQRGQGNASVMTLLAAACDFPRDVIPAIKPSFF